MKALKYPFFTFVSAMLMMGSGFADYPKNLQEIKQAEYEYLNRLALEAGTDKSSNFHNYTKVYADYFGPIRNETLKFLEIGIYHGDSVKLWENYFPQSELHFIDCNSSWIKYFSNKSKYHFIDQANAPALKEFAESIQGGFDIIIDDGGHFMDQQIISFQALFPYVKSGGLYIIEDLHTSYWSWYGGGGDHSNPKSGPGTCIDFLQNLIDDLNYVGANTSCANRDPIPSSIKESLNEYQEQIDSIHFHSSVCIIRKK